MIYDAIIVGAGVTGCAVARELSRYSPSVLVVDRESDVCEGTSKANSAIIHAGFDALPGTLKARFNVEGNAMMDRLSAELDIPFRRNGALVVCWSEAEMPKLLELLSRGERNGVPGLRLLTGNEARELEANLQGNVFAALSAPTSGIVCPFEMTIAFAENACANGARFSLSTEVRGIRRDGEGFVVETSKGECRARCVINCAGVYADRIHDMVCGHDFEITARKGEYLLLDKSAGLTVGRTVFQAPTAMGKGVLVTPTVHGNLLVGPTAADIDDREDTATTRSGLEALKRIASMSVRDIPFGQAITSFVGLRATGSSGDFIIREDGAVPGFFDVAGIESPGLSSAPAIGVYVADLVRRKLSLSQRPAFDPVRRGIPKVADLPFEERRALIAGRPDYGRIICRCEQISEGEILDSIRRPLGATTLDGVKRRVRAGMGRCQAGFCSPRVMEILAEELKIPYGEVKKNG